MYQRKTIEAFPDYEVDTRGNVYSNKLKGKSAKLKGGAKSTGYPRVHLTRAGKTQCIHIHRLVAKAFIPNPKNRPQVNHRDDNPANNNVKNLYWGTQKENMQDALRSGKHVGCNKFGEDTNGAKLNEKQVRVIRHIFTIPGHITQTLIAKIFNIGEPAVSSIKNGSTWKRVQI